MSWKILFPVAASLALLTACGPKPMASGEGWRQTDSLDGGFVNFVEIDKAHAQDGATYKAAAEAVCPPDSCFQTGFFVAGDPSPAGQFRSRGAFFGAGGWGGFSPAAVYIGKDREYTTWDCEKAGAKDAPLSALCGADIKAQYDAALWLATRVGWTKACGLPETDDRALFEKFLALPSQAGRRDQFKKAFDDMYGSSLNGPDDPADCVALRGRIEANAREARATVRKALKAA